MCVAGNRPRTRGRRRERRQAPWRREPQPVCFFGVGCFRSPSPETRGSGAVVRMMLCKRSDLSRQRFSRPTGVGERSNGVSLHRCAGGLTRTPHRTHGVRGAPISDVERYCKGLRFGFPPPGRALLPARGVWVPTGEDDVCAHKPQCGLSMQRRVPPGPTDPSGTGRCGRAHGPKDRHSNSQWLRFPSRFLVSPSPEWSTARGETTE